MGVGRFVCVALPLILTACSIVAMLVATLSGVTNKNLYIFSVDLSNVSINPADLDHIFDAVKGDFKFPTRSVPVALYTRDQTDNITASELNDELGIDLKYDISLWGYCHSGKSNDDRKCTKPEFDWASKSLNTSFLEDMGKVGGQEVKLPKEVQDALKAFRELSKWTEVAFIIAMILLGLELVVGIFATCSRGISCLTWLIASFTNIFVAIAAAMATAMGALVVGAIEGTAKYYGAKAKLNTQFLATVWIAVAFAWAAGFFWIFTICCCKPEHRNRKNRHSGDGEKLLPTRGYAPLNEHEHEMSHGYYNNNNNNHNQSDYSMGFASSSPRYPSGSGRTDLAYEPYSHRP